MSNFIKSRLKRLEAKARVIDPKLITIIIEAGETESGAMKRAGISPSMLNNEDTIIFITNYTNAEEPAL